MSLFNRKTELLPLTEFRIGELDYSIPGGYDNIISYPLEVRPGKNVYVEVHATNPVDVSVVDTKGMNAKFKESITDDTIGPVPTKEKGIMAVVIGVYRGDRSDVKIKAWME